MMFACLKAVKKPWKNYFHMQFLKDSKHASSAFYQRLMSNSKKNGELKKKKKVENKEKKNSNVTEISKKCAATSEQRV